MKDDNGLYYYPFPQNKNVRMYVRKDGDSIAFRLWNTNDHLLWENHGWVPYEAIKQAAAIYKGNAFEPDQTYDINLAEALIKGGGQGNPEAVRE